MERSKKEREDEFNTLELHHYTTFESLEKIVKSKTLKLNRNDRVNDIVETGRTVEFNGYYYASCFTYSCHESIPLWYIYSKEKNGVMISVINRDFFTGDIFYIEDDCNVYIQKVNKSKDHEESQITLNAGFSELQNIHKAKVLYDDLALLKCVSTSSRTGPIQSRLTNVYQMSAIKSEAWAFETEARFFAVLTTRHKDINSVFYGLNDLFFDDMVITINPFLNETEVDEKIKYLKNLLSNYNVSIRKSSLWGKIR